MTKMPFILLKASGMPMANSLEESIKNNGYSIKKIYNISNGWETIKNFYLNEPDKIEFNLEVEIHRWLEKYLYGEAAYIIFIDTTDKKSFDEKCNDALKIKREFRNKYTLSRDGTFMVALDVSRTHFKPLLKWKKGLLKVGNSIFDPDMPQKGVFRGYYFKYAHTPDNAEEYDRHMKILQDANLFCPENEVSPTQWNIIKCAVLGDTKTMTKIIKNENKNNYDMEK